MEEGVGAEQARPRRRPPRPAFSPPPPGPSVPLHLPRTVYGLFLPLSGLAQWRGPQARQESRAGKPAAGAGSLTARPSPTPSSVTRGT